MRAPSEKKLLEAFRDLDKKGAKLIRSFAKADVDPETLEELVAKVPATEAYARQMYSDPYDSGMWRVTVVLHAINEIVGGYSVEALGPSTGPGYASLFEYINMGDTYATTLIYDRDKDRLFIGDWGTIVEAKGEEWEDNPRRRTHSIKRKTEKRTINVRSLVAKALK